MRCESARRGLRDRQRGARNCLASDVYFFRGLASEAFRGLASDAFRGLASEAFRGLASEAFERCALSASTREPLGRERETPDATRAFATRCCADEGRADEAPRSLSTKPKPMAPQRNDARMLVTSGQRGEHIAIITVMAHSRASITPPAPQTTISSYIAE